MLPQRLLARWARRYYAVANDALRPALAVNAVRREPGKPEGACARACLLADSRLGYVVEDRANLRRILIDLEPSDTGAGAGEDGSEVVACVRTSSAGPVSVASAGGELRIDPSSAPSPGERVDVGAVALSFMEPPVPGSAVPVILDERPRVFLGCALDCLDGPRLLAFMRDRLLSLPGSSLVYLGRDSLFRELLWAKQMDASNPLVDSMLDAVFAHRQRMGYGGEARPRDRPGAPPPPPPSLRELQLVHPLFRVKQEAAFLSLGKRPLAEECMTYLSTKRKMANIEVTRSAYLSELRTVEKELIETGLLKESAAASLPRALPRHVELVFV